MDKRKRYSFLNLEPLPSPNDPPQPPTFNGVRSPWPPNSYQPSPATPNCPPPSAPPRHNPAFPAGVSVPPAQAYPGNQSRGWDPNQKPPYDFLSSVPPGAKVDMKLVYVEDLKNPPPDLLPHPPQPQSATIQASKSIPASEAQAVFDSGRESRRPRRRSHSRRRPKRPTPPPQRPSEVPVRLSRLERHAIKCRICRHSRREEIELAFLRWHSAKHIAFYFNLRDRHSVYRHARELKLFERRNRNLRAALENLIEKSATCQVSGETVIHAIRAYACMTDYVKWVEPAKTNIIIPGVPVSVSSRALPAGSRPRPPAASIVVAPSKPIRALPPAPAPAKPHARSRPRASRSAKRNAKIKKFNRDRGGLKSCASR
ncbi:MAG TPA: hypothetical protein VJR23_00975 [Candidatus Acidoferrales bacterium]|nr:hypothetical protein [Candidatus Acidoferrales bacterium]